jgi:hypothetical protein
MARDLFNHPEHSNGVYLQAAKRLRTRHAIQTGLEHGIDHGAGEAPLFFSLRSVCIDDRRNVFYPGQQGVNGHVG